MVGIGIVLVLWTFALGTENESPHFKNDFS